MLAWVSFDEGRKLIGEPTEKQWRQVEINIYWNSLTKIIYHLLTESEVITGKSQTKALMYWPSNSEVDTSRPIEVWDFPVMTERTRLISYLLYGLFCSFLKKNTIRTPEVIFHIRLGAPWLSSLLILKCFCMLVFLSVIENIVVPPFDHLFCCFRPRSRCFYSQLKRAEKNFTMHGHYKKIMPTQQPIRAGVLL